MLRSGLEHRSLSHQPRMVGPLLVCQFPICTNSTVAWRRFCGHWRLFLRQQRSFFHDVAPLRHRFIHLFHFSISIMLSVVLFAFACLQGLVAAQLPAYNGTYGVGYQVIEVPLPYPQLIAPQRNKVTAKAAFEVSRDDNSSGDQKVDLRCSFKLCCSRSTILPTRTTNPPKHRLHGFKIWISSLKVSLPVLTELLTLH
jgi:hypothetical protein